MNVAYEQSGIGRGVAAFRHLSLSSAYTYYSLRAMRPMLHAFSDAETVFGAITKARLLEVPVVDPGPCVVAAFEESVDSIDRQNRHLVAESKSLESLRDALLPKLITGE